MASMSTPAGWEPYRSPKAPGGRRCLPPVAVRPPGPHPRAGRPPATRWSRSRWPTRCSSTSTRTTPGGRSSSTSPSRWRRSRWWPRSSGPLLDRAVGGRRWMLIGVTAGRAARVLRHDRRPPEPAALPGGVRGAGDGQGLRRVAQRHRADRRARRQRAGRGQLEAPAAVGPGRAAGRDPRRASPSRSRGPRGARGRGGRLPAATLAALRIPATQIAADAGHRGRVGRAARRRHPARRVGHGAGARHRRLPHVPAPLRPPRRPHLEDGRGAHPHRRWRAGRVGGRPRRCAAASSRSGCSRWRSRWPSPAASRPPGSASWPGSMLLAAIVAIVSTSGKLAFDSLVQRDAPDANRGRSFASFELRFQIVWVIGAVIPVLDHDPAHGRLPRHRRRSPASRCSPTSPASGPPTATPHRPTTPPPTERRPHDDHRPHADPAPAGRDEDPG